MPSTDFLRARIGELDTEARAILDTAETEGRTLTSSERAAFDSIASDLDNLRGQLDHEVSRNDRLQRAANARNAILGDTDAPTPPTWHRTDPAPRLEHRGGRWLAHELRALTGGASSGASFTPPEFASYFFDRLAAQSVALAAGLSVIQTVRDTLTVPRVLTDGSSAFVAEGGTITESTLTADTITATPRKLAALSQVTNELIADSNPGALQIVADNLVRSIALKLDLGVFEGTGTAPDIRGLKNVSGIGTVSLGTNGATPTNLDPFADAIGTLASANAAATAIIMHPRTWQTLSKVKEVTGGAKPVLSDGAGSVTQAIQRSIYGVPVYLTSQLSITETQGTSTDCSSAYVIQADQVVAVLRNLYADPWGIGGPLNLSDGGDMLANVARLELDRSRLFNSDQAEIRAVMRADIIVPNPGAVVRVLGIRP